MPAENSSQDSTVLQHTPPANVFKTTSTGGDHHRHRQHGGAEDTFASATANPAAEAAAAATEAEAEAHAGIGGGGVDADVSSSNSEGLFSLGTDNSSCSGGGGGGEGEEGGALSESVAAVERCEDCGRTFAPGRLRSHAKARRETWLRFPA